MKPALGLVSLIALVSLTACSGSATPTVTQTVIKETVVVTETATPKPVETGAPVVASTSDAPATTAAESFTMPSLVGQNLQLGQDKLQALGSFLLDQEDASGLGRLQINDSNWTICAQTPKAGSKVPVETVVLLSSVKIGEDCP